jgi:cytochrome oxidase assembly protein ShyY1
MEYVVKAETRDGKTVIVKRGFASREDAEEHPVRMSEWKRVWVEAFRASDASATG